MIAKEVEVLSKSNASESGICWKSQGKGTFTLTSSDKATRGTQVILYVKDEEAEFLQEWKLKELIKKYSNYVNFPIQMLEVENEQNKNQRKFEKINDEKGIWNKNKAEIKDEEYQEFYSQLTYDFQKPLTHLHITTEGAVSYK